jgi:hypothetical protein
MQDCKGVHASTSAQLPVVDIISRGDQLTVLSMQPDWVRVRTEHAKAGYVKAAYLGPKLAAQAVKIGR